LECIVEDVIYKWQIGKVARMSLLLFFCRRSWNVLLKMLLCIFCRRPWIVLLKMLFISGRVAKWQGSLLPLFFCIRLWSALLKTLFY